MEYKCKSLLIARMPRGEHENKTAVVKLFSKNDPHLTENFPTEELVFENTKRVILHGMTVKYMTEGNDLIVNDLKSVKIEEVKGHHTVEIWGK